jgi:hypothetical protein
MSTSGGPGKNAPELPFLLQRPKWLKSKQLTATKHDSQTTINNAGKVLASKNWSAVDCDVVRFVVGCYVVARNAAIVRLLT